MRKSDRRVAYVVGLMVAAAGCRESVRGAQEDLCAQYIACLEDVVDGAGAAAESQRAVLTQAKQQYGESCNASASARSTCDSACSQGLVAAHQVYPSTATCVAPALPDAGSTVGNASCDRYLSCLLATNPAAYAPAVQLYGAGSACWATPTQAAGCGQACEAALATSEVSCTCSGSTCMRCQPLANAQFGLTRISGTCPTSLRLDELRFAAYTGNTIFTNPGVVDVSISSAGPQICGAATMLRGRDHAGCNYEITIDATTTRLTFALAGSACVAQCTDTYAMGAAAP